ncbi:MAG: 3-deoxy-8-phosphooctulonate synthase [Firmicutes bacterium]|nr:3-deoxy-8-phosphooctulonate synthase [Bacillota bacterium]
MKKLIIIAGPCLAESEKMVKDTAEHLQNICAKFPNIDFYFKASYKKANRSSYSSFSGVGDEKALRWLNDIRKMFNLKVLTDVHSVDEAKIASDFVDVLQIPAFLSRQTEILVAAANTGLTVNVKKGQFLAPDDMKKAADKISATGNNKIWLTERGTFFGYHDLVVDFRSLLRMKKIGYPVIYDATHSLQLPSIGEQSGGTPEFIIPMAKAAISVGVDGVFFETHPDPTNAKSDAQTQLPLNLSEKFISMLVEMNAFAGGLE